MAKRKVIQRKKVRVAPDREEEIEEVIEVDERKSVAEQADDMRRASLVCPDCLHMAPRQCRAHRINLPI